MPAVRRIVATEFQAAVDRAGLAPRDFDLLAYLRQRADQLRSRR